MFLLHNAWEWIQKKFPVKWKSYSAILVVIGMLLYMLVSLFSQVRTYSSLSSLSSVPSLEASRLSEERFAQRIQTIANQKPIVLDSSYRNPFRSYLHATAPLPSKPKIKKNAPKTKPIPVIPPPTFTIQGFLGGKNPIAIIKQGNKTELVRKGDVIWDVKILSVEAGQMTVLKKGKTFILTP
jgi:hypothetical protein